MKIAICQTEIKLENKLENLKKAESFLSRASMEGAELACFPEMSLTGFTMRIENMVETDFWTVERMKECAIKYEIAIGFGWSCQEKDGIFNHYTVVDQHGRILGDYRKIHPFSCGGEGKYYQGGDRLCTFTLHGMTIGLTICYDLRFPEVFQVLAERCDIILVPANWPEKRILQWRALLPARALETQVYILGINCVGIQNRTNYTGESAAFHPDGTPCCDSSAKEELLFVDVTAPIAYFREKFPSRRDRKWALYQQWYGTVAQGKTDALFQLPSGSGSEE